MAINKRITGKTEAYLVRIAELEERRTLSEDEQLILIGLKFRVCNTVRLRTHRQKLKRARGDVPKPKNLAARVEDVWGPVLPTCPLGFAEIKALLMLERGETAPTYIDGVSVGGFKHALSLGDYTKSDGARSYITGKGLMLLVTLREKYPDNVIKWSE